MTVLEIEELLAQDQKQQEAVTTDRAPSPTPVEIPPHRTASPNNSTSQREVGEQQQQHTVDSPRIPQAEQNCASGGRVKLPKLTLKKFNDEMISWAPFWDSYQSSVHTNTFCCRQICLPSVPTRRLSSRCYFWSHSHRC